MAKQSTSPQSPDFQKRFLLPQFWGIWLGAGLLRLLSLIPYPFKLHTGKALGKLLFLIAAKRKRLAKANIDLCFPEKNEDERRDLVKKHFESLGIGLMEMSLAWYGAHKKDHAHAAERNLVRYMGEEHLREAQARGKGVLILSPHFTTLELTGLFVSFLTHFNAVYRPHDNPLMDYLIAKGRTILYSNQPAGVPIANSNTRGMLKTLKAGGSLGFLPDQRYRAKGHIEVPFFDHAAKSNPATSKIAKLTGCAVVPTFTRRLDNGTYEVEFLPALDNFPSGDDYADTLRLHQLYEAEIRHNPAQYLWVHNRWNLKNY
ncbi:lipid A biosynthesis acyltransferase [Thiomicrorhabdus sp. zzn3]|uniref:LpxL/LpxP family acyltransferase n=1 Tax=Thiomicrorhabdus sp. zzn3 TaxID=3039775 RepID=UPI0024366C95|nr:lipid A biosynthesis acyltransferase [Thiomicrorhabdus sp. zzn3]MDG6779031.1 lipid A biosynthesis acyltransferase [Thiomicrorhabdus sp. zzn3]